VPAVPCSMGRIANPRCPQVSKMFGSNFTMRACLLCSSPVQPAQIPVPHVNMHRRTLRVRCLHTILKTLSVVTSSLLASTRSSKSSALERSAVKAPSTLQASVAIRSKQRRCQSPGGACNIPGGERNAFEASLHGRTQSRGRGTRGGFTQRTRSRDRRLGRAGLYPCHRRAMRNR
jgi:hypothetical protein